MEQLFTASLVLLMTLAGSGLAPPGKRMLKAIWTAIGFALFTAALYRCIGSPLAPSFAGLRHWDAIWAQALEALWWLTGARLAVTILHVWAGADRKLGNSRLATDLIGAVLYLVAALAITNDVFQIPVVGLVATSGVIAIVLGLALQSTLSDVFSGISINIEQPFEVGDVIQLDGAIEGTVTQVNWRATHILTGTRDAAIMPNSAVAKARIINRSRPARQRGVTLTICLDTRTPTQEGIRVLQDALLTAALPMRDPAPGVQCTALHGNGVDYEVSFTVHSDTDVPTARTEVLGHIHHALAWAGIPVARTEGVLPDLPNTGDLTANAVRKLSLIGLFKALSTEEIAALAGNMARRTLAPGEVAIAQGMKTDHLFIIEHGVLEITHDPGTGQVAQVGRLGPGDHFGEMSLLTGEAASATGTAITPVAMVLLAYTDLAPLLQARPALAKELGVFVEEQRSLFAGRIGPAFHSTAADHGNDALLARIERFFHLGDPD